MSSTVVVGGFFGDEGKGKIISYLAIKDNPKIIVRGGAGPNAGHTIRDGDKTYKVRMLPSGFLNKTAKVMIGPGVVINPSVLLKEIQDFGASGRAFIDKHCGIIEESHLLRDSKGELKEKIGSTGSGTGPANADRAMRILKLAKDIDSLSSLIVDVPEEINTALSLNQNVLVEGTQGTFLSLWHGTYPFVTSKDVTASGICADVGLGPKKVDEVIVVFKAYVTRVGTGPLSKELSLEEAERKGWSEFGT
ncbi:MAG TPA: adenylosuccinate synthetase, partial [Nitrosarchaeum sp.]|nr:adenylosuccinate synthetase [Nitrosarchaeum sp.]